MGKSKAGRKRKAGERYPGGKLKPLFIPGSERVIINRARFVRFQGGKAEQQVFDPIGRAWAVGLLENDRVDPAALRDAGRDYAARYWGYYQTVSGVATYDGDAHRRGFSADGPDPIGLTFERMDRMLRDAGRTSHDATQSLCLDFYWFPDDNPAWLERLINTRFVAAHVPVCGQLSQRGDGEQMIRALCGLLALADGVKSTRSLAA